MITSEKQLTTKATTDTFDEIYTNYDVSVNEEYLAQSGYPFDYPTRWLNDPSQNKRIAIRRLDVTPSTHSFTLTVTASDNGKAYEGTATIDVTHEDSLIKVLNFMSATFSKTENDGTVTMGLTYEYNVNTNELTLCFIKRSNYSYYEKLKFSITAGVDKDHDGFNDEIKDFLQFLNQPVNDDIRRELSEFTYKKTFTEVWSRDRIHFHASFSTSRRKFIGKRGDFYQNLSLLYPPPTNESTFYIRFTSNGMKNILIRYCEFDIQLCFIVNYKNSIAL